MKDFLVTKPKVSKVDSLVLEARVDGNLSFSQLGDNMQKSVIRQLILRASAISGLPVSGSQFILDALEDQLCKYLLKFNFENLNESEMELAFQMNQLNNVYVGNLIEIDKVEPFGSFVSVAYMAKVLGNYRILRNAIDRKLKNFIDGNGYNY